MKYFPSIDAVLQNLGYFSRTRELFLVGSTEVQLIACDTWDRDSFPGKHIRVTLSTVDAKYCAIAENFPLAIRKALRLWQLDSK